MNVLFNQLSSDWILNIKEWKLKIQNKKPSIVCSWKRCFVSRASSKQPFNQQKKERKKHTPRVCVQITIEREKKTQNDMERWTKCSLNHKFLLNYWTVSRAIVNLFCRKLFRRRKIIQISCVYCVLCTELCVCASFFQIYLQIVLNACE